MNKKETISFYNQGCRLNQSETAILTQSFQEKGYEIVNFEQPAAVVVVNTCTVTENGDNDTRKLVNKITRVNPDAKIALVGCQAQILKEKLLKLPNVTWVVGNALKMDLPALIDQYQAEPTVNVSKITREPFTLPIAGIDTTHTRANLKIQDGCDFYCSFCVIPFARGPARSRYLDDIMKETRILTEAGHQEVVLTGINIGTYQDGEYKIEDVINQLETIDKLKRIRISSIEPTTIPDKIVKKMGPDAKLCRHLHVPLQSGSDTVLKLMARKYNCEEFSTFINYVANAVPDICIGTDVIVGFPGETDELFEQTRAFMAALPLAYFHVFSYSERQFARSHKLEGKLPKSIIARRSLVLRQLSTQKKNQFMQRFIGKTVSVLVEQKKRGTWVGLTDHYLKVRFESDIDTLKNTLVSVRLTALDHDALLGELV